MGFSAVFKELPRQGSCDDQQETEQAALGFRLLTFAARMPTFLVPVYHLERVMFAPFAFCQFSPLVLPVFDRAQRFLVLFVIVSRCGVRPSSPTQKPLRRKFVQVENDPENGEGQEDAPRIAGEPGEHSYSDQSNHEVHPAVSVEHGDTPIPAGCVAGLLSLFPFHIR